MGHTGRTEMVVKRVAIVVLLVGALGATCTFVVLGRSAPPASVAGETPAAPSEPLIVAGPGRVEPISEEIRVSADVNGRIEAVLVEEGDRVTAGQVIARLENVDYRARVAASEATRLQKEAELRRVVNGAREQERREALAAVKAAEAVLANARVEAVRRRELVADGTVAQEEADRSERDLRVAQARHEEAVYRHATVDAQAREEDRSRAAAEVALARARVEEAKADLNKTLVRSPVAGIVLRKHRKAGESVSTQFDSPIVTVADDSRLRVRIDVDETDVGRIRSGQRAYVTADAFRGQKFWGRVVRVGRVLGKKNVQTDEPAERVDTKVLETLVGLDDGHELPIGLRVNAFVITDRARPAPGAAGKPVVDEPGLSPAPVLAPDAPVSPPTAPTAPRPPVAGNPAGADQPSPRESADGVTRYWVQVGAFKDQQAATRLAERLRAGSIPLADRILIVAAAGDFRARVRMGPFADRHAARSALRMLRARGFDPFVVAEGR